MIQQGNQLLLSFLTGRGEDDPVLGVNTHAVYQPGSQVLIKPGDEFKFRVILRYPLPKTTNRIQSCIIP